MLIIPDRGLEYPGFNSRHLPLPPQVALSDDPLTRGITRAFPLNNWQSRSLDTYTIDDFDPGTPEIEVDYQDITYTDGRPGFNGSSSSISLFRAHDIREDQSRQLFTVSLRCRPYSTGGTQYICGGAGSYIQFRIAGGVFQWVRESSAVLVADSMSIVADRDYILTAVYDFNNILDASITSYFYVDDRLAGTSTDSTQFLWQSSPILLGKRFTNANYFSGLISDFIFWDYPLSHGEISAYVANPRRIYRPVI